MTEPRADDDQEILEELQQLPICEAMSSCDPEGLAAMAKLGTIVRRPAGHTLFTRGGPADVFRFVLSGRVALMFDDGHGGDMTVGTASAGDLVGWSALRRDGTWTVTARTTKASRLLCFPGDAVRELCDRERSFGYCLMGYVFEAVAHRLADARLQMIDVYGRSRTADD